MEGRRAVEERRLECRHCWEDFGSKEGNEFVEIEQGLIPKLNYYNILLQGIIFFNNEKVIQTIMATETEKLTIIQQLGAYVLRLTRLRLIYHILN